MAGEQNAITIEQEWKGYEKFVKLSHYVKLIIADNRTYQLNNLQLTLLSASISNSFEKEHSNVLDDVNDPLRNILPITINIDVAYLNYAVSTSGNVIVKGYYVIINRRDFLVASKEFKIADDILISDFFLKLLLNSKNISMMNKAEAGLNESLAKQLISEFYEITKTGDTKIYEVVAFGKAIILNNDIKKAKNDAIANALLRGSSEVFGKKIQRETTMVDKGNVIEAIKESINGNVIEFQELNGFVKQSSDRYEYVLIKAVLKL